MKFEMHALLFFLIDLQNDWFVGLPSDSDSSVSNIEEF